MKLIKCFALAVAALVAHFSFADAANTLVMFSTKGPDYYAGSKTAVKDGEWYALVWSPRAEFGGLTIECTPVVEGDRLCLMAPLAEGAHCPLTAFQIDSAEAPVGGTYFIYLLDTRDAGGKPSAADEKGMPKIVRGIEATSAKQTVSAGIIRVTDSELAKDDAGALAWSAADLVNVGEPVITEFGSVGENLQFVVDGMSDKVLYNVYTGAEADKLEKRTLTVPLTGGDNRMRFFLSGKLGRFFNVQRESLAE